MRTSHTAIRKRIENEKVQITDEQLFASCAYAAYLTDLAEAATGRYKRHPIVKTYWNDAPDADLAWTNNKTIAINAGNPVTQSFPTRRLRADSLVGMNGHEIGHMLYTDFTMHKAYCEAFRAGRFYPHEPGCDLYDDEVALDELRQFIADKDDTALEAVLSAALNLDNILEDIYIEARMCDAFPGSFRSGILLNSVRMMELMKPLAEQVAADYMGFSILCNLILQYCRSGDVNNLTDYKGEYLDKLLECILNEVAEEQAMLHYEDELTEELQAKAERINYGNAHKNTHVTVNRMRDPATELAESYKRVSPPLLLLSMRVQSKLTDLLKDKRDGGRQTGLLMGRRINARAFAQDDGKYFYNNRLPEEKMNLAVALLVDESGSMSGCDRITYARAASVVMYDFCRKLDIPVIVYGHTSYGEDVDLFAYAEFDTIDSKDAYRMMDMSARSGNRDGAALRYVSERLMTRDEETKLLILISDGQPASSGLIPSSRESNMAFRVKLPFSRKRWRCRL